MGASTVTSGILERTDGRIVVRARADLRRFAWIMVVIAAALVVIAAVVVLIVGMDAAAVFLLPGSVVAAAAPFAWMARETCVVQPGARRVVTGAEVIAFEEIAAVTFAGHVDLVHTKHGPRPIRQHVLRVVRGRLRELDALVAERERWLAGGGAVVSDEAIAGHRRRLGEMIDVMGLGAQVLARHHSEAAIRHAGELLARTLRVPLIDGDSQSMRVTGELDLSLTARIERGLERPEAPGPSPEGMSVVEQDGRLELSWRHSRLGLMAMGLVPAAIAIAGAVMALTSDRWHVELAIALVGAAIAAPLLPVTARGHGRHVLTVGGDAIHHRVPFGRDRRMALAALEHMSVNEDPRLPPWLGLVSDEDVIAVDAAPQRAHWIRARVMWHLATRARGTLRKRQVA